jgi:transketolase
MDVKYRALLEELVDSGRLNEWEQNAFQDMINRDDRFTITLSLKQKSIVNKAKKKYFDGEDVGNNESGLPEVYDNCKLRMDGNGCQIEANGIVLSEPVTRKEGQIILSWLTKILPELIGQDAALHKPNEEFNDKNEFFGEETTVEGDDPF